MGNCRSIQVSPLVSGKRKSSSSFPPVIATHSRFCRPQGVQKLRIKDSETARNLKIHDATSIQNEGDLMFRCGRGLAFSTLLDAKCEPIANIKRVTPRIHTAYLGSDSSLALIQIYVKFGEWCSQEDYYSDIDLRVYFQDAIPELTHCMISLEGNWHSHDAVFWLNYGKSTSQRDAIARVVRLRERYPGGYIVEIVPNVDAALVLLLCLLLDDAVREQKSTESHSRR